MEENSIKVNYNTKLIKEIIEDSRRTSKNEGLVTGVRTGFYDLDYMTAGFQKGDLIFLSGRMGIGKTPLVLSIVDYILKEGKKVAYFSLSSTAKKIMTGLLSMNSEVKVWDISNGTVKENDMEKLKNGAEVVSILSLHIEDELYTTASDIRSMCRMLKSTGGLDFIVIYGLQYVAPYTAANHYDMRGQRSEVMHILKKLAVEIECPILMVSSLDKYDVPKDNRRPDITDLRENDCTALYSDVIMFLHKVDEDEYDLIIAKNRSRREGIVKLKPRLEYSKFDNYSFQDR